MEKSATSVSRCQLCASACWLLCIRDQKMVSLSLWEGDYQRSGIDPATICSLSNGRGRTARLVLRRIAWNGYGMVSRECCIHFCLCLWQPVARAGALAKWVQYQGLVIRPCRPIFGWFTHFYLSDLRLE